jgi:hypothetical protein
MSNDTKTIEDFIQDKVLPEYQPIVQAFRTLIRKDFPELKEDMRGGTEAYYSVPVYRLNHIVITISPTKQGITFAFSEGKAFEDKYKMLEGTGNKTLNIRLKSIDDFNTDKMRYYVQQAVTIDTQGDVQSVS